MNSINIIAAVEINNGIGNLNSIPWILPEDLNYFYNITTSYYNSAIIMGKNTWLSIPKNKRPLKNRLNIVISSTLIDESVFIVKSLNEAIELSKNNKIFIIGGEQLYNEAIKIADTIYITQIYKHYECDRFFPNIKLPLLLTSSILEHNSINYQYLIYGNSKSVPILNFEPEVSEHDITYFDLVKNVLENGVEKIDRTNTGTISLFGTQSRYNLRKGLPMLTSKKIYIRSVIEELLWFMRGETNAKILQDKNVHIWDGNSTREYLDSIGLTDNKEGDLGPVYGFPMRHYGANYDDCDTDYTGQGYDQISEIIRLIKEEPWSRRIVLSLWNPNTLHKVALPPCHLLYQFYVNDGELSCSMYQRSGDIGLGVPFNILSSSILVHILAKICNLKVGDFIHTIGDAHIYSNHIKVLKKQLKNKIYAPPKLEILADVDDPKDLLIYDFNIIGYWEGPKLRMKMAI